MLSNFFKKNVFFVFILLSFTLSFKVVALEVKNYFHYGNRIKVYQKLSETISSYNCDNKNYYILLDSVISNSKIEDTNSDLELMPKNKQLIIDSGISDESNNIKTITYNCISLADAYNLYEQKNKNKLAESDSIMERNLLRLSFKQGLKELLSWVAKNDYLLFLPIMIPAITKLKQADKLSPLVYVKELFFDYSKNDKIKIKFFVPNIYHLPIVAKQDIQNQVLQAKGRYTINLSQGYIKLELYHSNNRTLQIEQTISELPWYLVFKSFRYNKDADNIVDSDFSELSSYSSDDYQSSDELDLLSGTEV